jgi:hypothetical protein
MKRLFLILLSCLLLVGVSEAVQTRVIVRAKAKDAKFIGSMMGGALVVIRDSDTGEVLARGFTSGGTGDTRKIMMEPLKRGVSITDKSAAKFEAVLDISEPKLVTIEVSAPYAQRQSLENNSTQVWLIPGKDITGDGIVVDVYGFAVKVLLPRPHEMLKLAGGTITVPVQTNVVMMCGCPVTAGGLWDADKYEVKALITHDGKTVETIPLSYANRPNTFEGRLEVTAEGAYEMTVYAFDPATGNSGVDRTTFLVGK